MPSPIRPARICDACKRSVGDGCTLVQDQVTAPDPGVDRSTTSGRAHDGSPLHARTDGDACPCEGTR